MSFPWGWLLVHIGVGLLFKREVDKWASRVIYESPIPGDVHLVIAAQKQDGAESESSDEEDEEGDAGSDLEEIGA